MKFSAWLYKSDTTKRYNRISKHIMDGSNNFPSHSSQNSILNFCVKYGLSDESRDALMQSWGEFEKLPYAIIALKPRVIKRI